jgi:hypothetical protein
MTPGISARTKAVAAVLGAVAVAGLVTAAPANAATIVYTPDNCFYSDAQIFDSNECPNALNIFYHPADGGGFAELAGNVSNYSSVVIGSTDYDYVFGDMAGTSTDGVGQAIRNNAASAYDTSSATYTIFYYTGYSGHAQTFTPNTSIDFDSTLRNEDASQYMN